MSTALDTQTKTRLKAPSLYKVVLLNDDYTPMEFVIQVIEEIFGKSKADAYQLTMEIHNNKRGVAGTYTREVAEAKAQACKVVATAYKHPFQAVVEVA